MQGDFDRGPFRANLAVPTPTGLSVCVEIVLFMKNREICRIRLLRFSAQPRLGEAAATAVVVKKHAHRDYLRVMHDGILQRAPEYAPSTNKAPKSTFDDNPVGAGVVVVKRRKYRRT